MIAWLRNLWPPWRDAHALNQERLAVAIAEARIAEQLERLRDERAQNRFYDAWFAQLALPLPPAPPAEPDWSRADAGALRAFLGTETGQRLVARARFYEAELHGWAVLGDNSATRERACGFAAGFRGAFAYWMQLSSFLPTDPQDAPPTDLPGDEARETTSP